MKNKIYDDIGIAGIIFSILSVIFFKNLGGALLGLIGLVFCSIGRAKSKKMFVVDIATVGWAISIGATDLSIIFYLNPWF